MVLRHTIHPNAPAGGGGPGIFKSAQPAGSNGPFDRWQSPRPVGHGDSQHDRATGMALRKQRIEDADAAYHEYDQPLKDYKARPSDANRKLLSAAGEKAFKAEQKCLEAGAKPRHQTLQLGHAQLIFETEQAYCAYQQALNAYLKAPDATTKKTADEALEKALSAATNCLKAGAEPIHAVLELAQQQLRYEADAAYKLYAEALKVFQKAPGQQTLTSANRALEEALRTQTKCQQSGAEPEHSAALLYRKQMALEAELAYARCKTALDAYNTNPNERTKAAFREALAKAIEEQVKCQKQYIDTEHDVLQLIPASELQGAAAT